MKYQTQSEEGVRTAMICEAIALLRILDADQPEEDINENAPAREARLNLHAMARRLGATMIAELQAPVGRSVSTHVLAAAA